MGRLEYKESSSDDVNGAPEIRIKKEPEERQATGGDVDDELRFGEQLQDDLINSFCDKLQAVCPRRLEAFMAIQFLMITDIGDIRKHVTGKHPAMQVLYDRTRSHYVLVHYNPRYQKVEIYDSLQPWSKSGEPEILTELSTHISHLFGHLYTKYVSCVVDREYEAQSDNFSCGYRVIGALVDLARQRNPATQRYSRTQILDFMRTILAHPNPTWQMFETAKFAKSKEYTGQYRTSFYLRNTTYTSSTTTSSSRSSCKRTSSIDSLASQTSDGNKGDTERGGGGKAKKIRRAYAGHQLPKSPLEYMRPVPMAYHTPYIPIAYRYPTTYFGVPPYYVTYSMPPPPPPIPVPSPSGDYGFFGYFRNGYQWMTDNFFRRRVDGFGNDLEHGKE